MPDRLRTLLNNLQRPELFPHPVDAFEIIETHISFVLLTGPYAYKFKKPVDFGFVDFHTLERRLHYCEEELRLNRRFAPELYVCVEPIYGDVSHPHFRPGDQVIEYSVKMRQFPAAMRLDLRIDHEQVTVAQIRAFAEALAGFHERAERADSTGQFGTPALIEHFIMQNFVQVRPCVERSQLDELESWSRDELRRCQPLFLKRLEYGYVRECHGDMHLANMIMHEDRIKLFDCLEFNDELRWIDVASEIAFLYMDLYYRDHVILARSFLSAYLEHSGDYGALEVLRLYLSYRAMVRAKVACLRQAQTAADQAAQRQEIDRHIELARRLRQTSGAALGIMFGLSGSGKSVMADRIVEHAGAIRLRSDAERRRMFDFKQAAGVGQGRYGPERIEQVYQRLESLAEQVVKAGFHVIVDATFLQRSQRERFARLAQALKVPFYICACAAPDEVLAQRIEKRERAGRDASEAGLSVLAYQRQRVQALTADEQNATIRVDTSHPQNIAAALARISAAVT